MQLLLLKKFTCENIIMHTNEWINQRQTLLRNYLYTGAQWQMSQHIFLRCKAAQDHLWIMNHDSLGFDKMQVDGESRQKIEVLYEQSTNAHRLSFMAISNIMYFCRTTHSLI